jgi:hypothetical protein
MMFRTVLKDSASGKKQKEKKKGKKVDTSHQVENVVIRGL